MSIKKTYNFIFKGDFMLKMISKVSLKILLFLFFFVSCSTQKSLNFKSSNDDLIQRIAASGDKDISISLQDVDNKIKAEIFELETKIFELRHRELRALLLEKFLVLEKKLSKESQDNYLKTAIYSNVTITDADVDLFIKQKGIPGDRVTDLLKERVKEFLRIEKEREALDLWIDGRMQKYDIVLLVHPPAVPVFSGLNIKNSPMFGNDNTSVTIFEFTDFECPYCAEANKLLERVKEHYGDKVRVVLKNFPLQFHKNARDLANLSLCVYEQNHEIYWKTISYFFENQRDLKAEDVLKILETFNGNNNEKIDSSKVSECFKTKKFDAQIEEDIKDGNAVGIKGTPSIFINNKYYSLQTLEDYIGVIENEIKLSGNKGELIKKTE